MWNTSTRQNEDYDISMDFILPLVTCISLVRVLYPAGKFKYQIEKYQYYQITLVANLMSFRNFLIQNFPLTLVKNILFL